MSLRRSYFETALESEERHLAQMLLSGLFVFICENLGKDVRCIDYTSCYTFYANHKQLELGRHDFDLVSHHAVAARDGSACYRGVEVQSQYQV